MKENNGFDLDVRRKRAAELDNRVNGSVSTTITITIGMTTSDNCSAPTCTCFCSWG